MLTAAAAISTALSIYAEVAYLSTKIVWQCLVGAAWTIASIVAALLCMIRIFNAYYDVEKHVSKIYPNADGEERVFHYAKANISAAALKAFLLKTELPEKLCVLSDKGYYSVIGETMEPMSFSRRFDLETKLYDLNGNTYSNVDTLFELLRADGFIDGNGDVCVIDYEYSTPSHLKKLVCGDSEKK